jgi:hypothetical protein
LDRHKAATHDAWGGRFFVGAIFTLPHRKEQSMAAYSPEKLLQLWKQEEVTADQAIGQLLQLVIALYQSLQQVEQRLRTVEQARSS